MRRDPEGFRLNFDHRLVEESVLLAIPGRADEGRFRSVRDRIYDEPDLDARDVAFQKLHAEWFVFLGLGDPLEQALDERSLLKAATRQCVVAPARSKKEEGADLFVSPPLEGRDEVDRRSIGCRLKTESFLEPDALLAVLRHEFLHIFDMLDPAFDYEPELPQSEGGAMAKRLLQDRYRVLWGVTIDGRLVREGRALAGVRGRREHEFFRTFHFLGANTQDAFSRFFDHPFRTHGELVAFAQAPHLAFGDSSRPDMRCPLCGFPTHAFEPNPQRIPAEVLTRIASDFPTWRPAQGLCPQCADLYRASPLSSAAEAVLPKIS